jgi:gliding motility-associated-like protein
MIARKLLIPFLLIPMLTAISQEVNAQACTMLGQTPATAFPVCGTSKFQQDSVPVCLSGSAPAPTCGIDYPAYNPFWYKFTCFNSGTLGLLISPNNPGDDYDWQIFDITGVSTDAVYTDSNLVVASNWSGVTGNTGTSKSAASYYECASDTAPATVPPPFSKMPDLIQGHNYLLLISHFSGDQQSGYSLSFGGGTAVITDTTQPALAGVQPICNSTLQITLNKKMNCASLAADGSDFTITPMPPGIQITGAFSAGCSGGFDMDTLTLMLNGNLPPGNYLVKATIGTDGNTLLDDCANQIPVDQSLPIAIAAPQPTPLDSITTPACAPSVLRLVFSKPIQCSSIAADGTDFSVTGPVSVSVIGASGNCDANGLTSTVLVQLSAPILVTGNFQLTLKAGSDGNTLINMCDLLTPAATRDFTTMDTVSAAAFSDQIFLGCKQDTIRYSYPPEDGVNQWRWVFDGTDTSTAQNPPPQIYSVFGNKTIYLIVSNGVCSDTTQASIVLGNAIKANFEAPNIMCPKDYAQFMNNSTGDIAFWNWEFGDGSSSDLQAAPDHLYPQTGIETKYNVLLIVTDSAGCSDTAGQQIDVLRSCFIAVPSAFTPNGDGINDYLYPLNAFKAVDLLFRVYNRNGQIVFETSDWTKKWDGTINGHPEPAGTFVWTLQYIDGETGKRIFQKGTSILIR